MRITYLLLIIMLFPLSVGHAEESDNWPAFPFEALHFNVSLPETFTDITMRKYAPDEDALASEKKAAAASQERQKLYDNMTGNNVYMYAMNNDKTWKFQLWITEDNDSRAIGSFWYYSEKEIMKRTTANASGDYPASAITLNDVKFALQTYKTKTMNMGLLHTVHDGKRYNFMLYTTHLDAGIDPLVEMLKNIGKKAAFSNIVSEAAVTLNKRNTKVSSGENNELNYTVPAGWGKIANDTYTDLGGNRLYVLKGESSKDVGASFKSILSKFLVSGDMKSSIGEPARSGLTRFPGFKITGTATTAKGEPQQLLAYLHAQGSDVYCVLYIGANDSVAMKDCDIIANSIILPEGKITDVAKSTEVKASGDKVVTMNKTAIVITTVLTIIVFGLAAALVIVLRGTGHGRMGKHIHSSKEVQNEKS
jgi:hypothetical protein